MTFYVLLAVIQILPSHPDFGTLKLPAVSLTEIVASSTECYAKLRTIAANVEAEGNLKIREARCSRFE